MKSIHNFVLIVFLISVSFADNYPRSHALGGTGVVMPEMGMTVHGNSACLSALNDHIFYISYYILQRR